MTYQTRIGIQIAGIRRSVPLVFEYHVETVDGIKQPIHDMIYIPNGKSRTPAKWIRDLIGPRQLAELQGNLIKHWKSRTAA